MEALLGAVLAAYSAWVGLNSAYGADDWTFTVVVAAVPLLAAGLLIRPVTPDVDSGRT